jgi:hypothetical protein
MNDCSNGAVDEIIIFSSCDGVVNQVERDNAWSNRAALLQAVESERERPREGAAGSRAPAKIDR